MDSLQASSRHKLWWARCIIVDIAVVACSAAFVPRVSAEWFADLYGGAAGTPRSDVTLIIRLPGLSADHTLHSVKWDTSASFGGRGGYWFEALPWLGIGLDVFHFGSNISTQTVPITVVGMNTAAQLQAIDFSITAIAFDVVRLRWPLLTSAEFPKGQLQPYFTVGPALFITQAKDTNNFTPGNQSVTDTSPGVKVGTGVAWQFSTHVAIFGEYRFTHFSPQPTFFNASPIPIQVPLQTDLNSHHLIAGISFRF